MATLTPKLTLTGSAADFGSALSLSVSDTLTVGQPFVGMSKVDVLHTAAFVPLTVTGNVLTTYVYLKNTHDTDYIVYGTDVSETNGIIGILHPDEFAFFPVQGERGLEVIANSVTCAIEYGYWTKA